MDKQKNITNKGYIFLSHSHKDLDIVRKIRNQFEENGIEPILFYLRCMDEPDSNDAKKLKELIHKEIDARDFVVYAKSANSENSKWVQEELSYINSTNPSGLRTIDIDQPYNLIKAEIDRIISNRIIYFSYAYKDKHLKDILKYYLQKHDYSVIDDTDILHGGESWTTQLKSCYDSVPENATVIFLYTENSLKSDYLTTERKYLLSNCNVNILSIFVGDVTLKYKEMLYYNEDVVAQGLVISDPPTDNELYSLTATLKNEINDTSWGPERKIFKYSCRPSYAVFNSIIDNPKIGDERHFVRIWDGESKKYVNNIEIVPGHLYKVIIYYHNNADERSSKEAIGIADGVQLTCNFPAMVQANQTYSISARISTYDCDPSEIWASCQIKSKTSCLLQYVSDSGIIYNNGKLNGESIGPEYLFGKGALLGFNKFSGMLPGGEMYSGYITFNIFVKECDNGSI